MDVLRKDGVKFIYQGYFWYALHYSINYSVQISCYETMVQNYKKWYPQQFYGHEFAFIAPTAFVCGMVGSAISNPIEVIAVCKQADPSTSLRKITDDSDCVRRLMTRGLGARVCYHST